MRNIGIIGLAGSGKDLSCELILKQNNYQLKRYAFADPIKHIVNVLFDWNNEHSNGSLKEIDVQVNISLNDYFKACHIYENYNLNKYLDFPLAYQEFIELLGLEFDTVEGNVKGVTSPRKAYQIFGTEIGRDLLHENVWVNITDTKGLILPDVRFLNEAEFIRKHRGHIIKIVRPERKEGDVRVHVSEQYFNELPHDYVIVNEGTIKELEEKVKEVYNTILNTYYKD